MEPNDMEFGHWYVVDIAHNKVNPIHRAIAYNAIRVHPHGHGGGHCDVLGNGYGRPLTVHWRRLPYFQVIGEIEAMRHEHHSYQLPKLP